MKLAGIFQDLEYLYDFQRISYGGHFVFPNEAHILQKQVFIAINFPGNFVKISLKMNEILKFMQKCDEGMDERKAFYNLPTTAFNRRWEIKMRLQCRMLQPFNLQ